MNELKTAYLRVCKAAFDAAEAQREFTNALQNSKYEDLKIPDEIVDVIDYGRGSMTYEEFIEIMDERLKIE